MCADQLGVTGAGRDSGADRGRAQVDLTDQAARVLQSPPALADHHGVGRELLAEGHRDGVLQLGTADLEQAGKLLGLGGERCLQLGQCLEQPSGEQVHGQFDGGRVDVVGALAAVDVIQGVQVAVVAPNSSKPFERQVGNDLVGVHVRGGTGAALDHVDDELLVPPAGAQVLARRDDRAGLVLLQQAEVAVGHGSGLLDTGERGDQFGVRGQRYPADREVLGGSQGVHAVVGVGGDLPVAEQVVLDADAKAHRRHLWLTRGRRGGTTLAVRGQPSTRR